MRNPNFLAPVAAATLLTPLAACNGGIGGEDTCTSVEFGASQSYAGDPTVNDHDQATWRSGMEITIPTKPYGAIAVRGVWESAENPAERTKPHHFSEWVKTDPDGPQKLGLKIGQHAIFVSVQFKEQGADNSCATDYSGTFDMGPKQPLNKLRKDKSITWLGGWHEEKSTN